MGNTTFQSKYKGTTIDEAIGYINEIAKEKIGQIGTVTSLSTEHKDTLVDAINETFQNTKNNKDCIDTIQENVGNLDNEKIQKPTRLESDADIDNLENGIYYTAVNTTGLPMTVFGTLIQIQPHTSRKAQIWFNGNTFNPLIYYRVYMANNWLDWQVLHKPIDNLESDSETDALSANQGRILNEKLGETNTKVSDIEFRATDHESRLSSAENMLIDNSNMIGYLDNSFIELSGRVGNIDTALDNIISIQNSYIGGDNE